MCHCKLTSRFVPRAAAAFINLFGSGLTALIGEEKLINE
jgi:hypothetical protein